MDFLRTEVRPSSLPALDMDAMTANAIAASLVRGECRGACDYCGRILWEADRPIARQEWSMSLRETVDVTVCRQCLEGDEE
jgi:hypothetical protein